MLPAWAGYWLGRWRRRSGRYDARTLSCLQQAWRKSRSPRHLLGWLGFRRDLGFTPNSSQQAELDRLLPGLNGKALRRAINLLLELQDRACKALLREKDSDSADSVGKDCACKALLRQEDATSGDVRAQGALLQQDDATAGEDGARGALQLQLDRFNPNALQALACHSPPLAAILQQAGHTLDATGSALARLQQQQEAWRKEFYAFLADCRGSICVIGNAPTLDGHGLGDTIDRYRCVIRFNRGVAVGHAPATTAAQADATPGWVQAITRNCCQPVTHQSYQNPGTDPNRDRGTRTDVLVCSPNFIGELAAGSQRPRWLILSGCDVRYQLQDWRALVPLLESGLKVLTVPREPWRHLVRELHAPPSSGVLILTWLQDLFGDRAALVAGGFQDERYPAVLSRNVRHVLPWRRVGRRHNWPRELVLLQRWRAAGLQEPLTSPDR